jgi:hypothetical protein
VTAIDLVRCVMRLPTVTVDRLDRLAAMASLTLRCDVPRAAVIRAVLESWLDAEEDRDPAPIIEAIRSALIKRGRKAQQLPSQTRRIRIAQEGA